MPTTVILGASNDYHALHIHKALQTKGADALLFDTSSYPHLSTISWDPFKQRGRLNTQDRALDFDRINSVFWSTAGHANADLQHAEFNSAIALNDTTSMLKTFFLEERIYWCNSWQAMQFHKIKPRQLAVAAAIGLNIPHTYTGNDAVDISEFVACNQDAIYKPVYGGAHCARVTKSQLTQAHLKKVLKISPVTIQQYIPGINIRTFVIGEVVFSAAIESNAVDYRTESEPRITPMQIPAELARKAIHLKTAFGMQWTAIDWRKTNNDDYYFLEANPSPMFIHFEQQTGYPITDSLLKLLLQSPLL